jgi:hypothetical protein
MGIGPSAGGMTKEQQRRRVDGSEFEVAFLDSTMKTLHRKKR